MNILTCKKCKGSLKFDNNCLICLNCGEIYSIEAKEEYEIKEAECENEAMDKEENETILSGGDTDKHTQRLLLRLCGCGIVLTLVALFIWFFTSATPSKQIEKVLKFNNYNDFEVVECISMGNEVDDLNGDNQLVLLKKDTNGEIRYGIGAVNIEEKTVTDLAFGYGPLNIVIDKIFLSNEKINSNNLLKAASFIQKYGFRCFENQETAESYLRTITSEDGIIDFQEARQAIEDSISYILPDIQTSSEFYIVFEDGNANPTHYAALSSEMRYNWSHIFPENVYNVWKSNTDRSTQGTMVALYGQPYVQKEVWVVVDKNLQPIGTYNSLEAVKELFEKTSSNDVKTTKEENNGSQSNNKDINVENEKKGQTIKSDNEIIIGYTIYEPFAYENNGLVGFDIDLATEICRDMGLSPVFVEIDWEDRVSLLNSDEIDCIWNGVVKTSSAMNSMSLSEVYLLNEVEYENSTETEELVVGFKKGSSLVSKFNSALSKAKQNGIIDNLKLKYNVN